MDGEAPPEDAEPMLEALQAEMVDLSRTSKVRGGGGQAP
jgi:hypothetical protein